MIKLTARDVDILLSLRFGIVDEQDLIEELFASTEIDDASEEFREVVSRQVSQANKVIEEKNKKLVAASLRLFETPSDPEVLRTELFKIAKLYGKHHGKILSKTVISLEDINQDSVLQVLQEIFMESEKKQAIKRQRMLCRRVMKRLESEKFVRVVDVHDRQMSNRYYHLTKRLGKPWLEEYLGSRGLTTKVVSHNYHKMHAKHDAMVSEVNKVINRFAPSQKYSINTITSEDEIKSVAHTVHRERELKFNMKLANKQMYPDIYLQLSKEGKECHCTIEIDNGTQPFSTVCGKIMRKVPMLIICSRPERAKALTSKFHGDRRCLPVYITTMNWFKAGGIFETDFFDLGKWDMVQISVTHLTKS